VLSVSADEPRWLFKDVLHGRLGELLAPLLASPVVAASPFVKQHSMLHTNFTHAHHTRIRFGPKPYSLCGFNQFIDERDFTIVALSLQASVRKYLMPLLGVGEDSPPSPIYICHLLAADGASKGTESLFLKALHHNTSEASARGNKYSYLCGDDADAAATMVLDVLTLYHNVLNSTTQRALDLRQQEEIRSPEKNADPLHSQLLRISMHRPAIAALGNTVAELRSSAFASAPATNLLLNSFPENTSAAENA
jgi:hypothetical protein